MGPRSERKPFGTACLLCFSLLVFWAAVVAAGETPPANTAQADQPMAVDGPKDNARDLIQIYRLARESDPSFQRDRYLHEASPETYTQALAGYLPTLSAEANYRRTRQELISTDIAVYGSGTADYPSNSWSLKLTQPILQYALWQRISQAKEAVRKADFEFAAAQQDIILRVAETYFNALKAYDNLDFTRSKEASLTLTFELAQQRYESGLASITDFYDAKARLASVMAEKVRAENTLADALEALAEVTGQEVFRIAKLKYAVMPKDVAVGEATQGLPMVNPDPDDMDVWIETALKDNVAILAKRQAVEVAKNEIKMQKGGHWPELNMVGRTGQDYEGGSLFGGKSDVRKTEAMLEVSVPIYSGGAVSSRTREAQKLFQAAEQDLIKEIRRIRREGKDAFLGVKSAIENTAALHQSVMANQVSVEAKKEGFKSGLFPSVAVLDAERDLFLAKMAYAEAHYQYILNSLRLKRAVGSLDETDLGEINKWLE
ncbi:MAG: TolC family outer membrane protein [Pseudomonadota bacterium]